MNKPDAKIAGTVDCYEELTPMERYLEFKKSRNGGITQLDYYKALKLFFKTKSYMKVYFNQKTLFSKRYTIVDDDMSLYQLETSIRGFKLTKVGKVGSGHVPSGMLMTKLAKEFVIIIRNKIKECNEKKSANSNVSQALSA